MSRKWSGPLDICQEVYVPTSEYYGMFALNTARRFRKIESFESYYKVQSQWDESLVIKYFISNINLVHLKDCLYFNITLLYYKNHEQQKRNPGF